MPLGPIEPLTFVVGRQLALNQTVDAPTATRHGLVGALLGTGLIGPVIARELARRDAEAAARSVVTSPPGTPALTEPGAAVDRMLASLQGYLDSQAATVASLEAQAEQLKNQAQTLQTAKREALERLCDSVRDWQLGYESAGAKGTSKAKKSTSGAG